MSWNDERIEQLQSLWNEGKSASEIAEVLGDVTRNAVIGKAHRLGLSSRPSPIKKVVQKPKGMQLIELTERSCRWPLGDPRDADFHFCGAPIQVSMPYCSEHCIAAYQTLNKKGDD